VRKTTYLGCQVPIREKPVENVTGGKNAAESAKPQNQFASASNAWRTGLWPPQLNAAPNRASTSRRNDAARNNGGYAQTHGEEFGIESVVHRELEDLSAMVALEERRKRKRIALHWPVRLFRDPATPSVESTTENLTSNGFYCISKEPFTLGERLDCIIAIPAGSFGYNESPIRLQCRVRVARVEGQQDGFGLGCYIEDYDLLTSSKPPQHSMESSEPRI
jgi:hypothetical protein